MNIEKIINKKGKFDILKKFCAYNNRLYANDMIHLASIPTSLANGLYEKIGNDYIPCSGHVDDFFNFDLLKDISNMPIYTLSLKHRELQLLLKNVYTGIERPIYENLFISNQNLQVMNNFSAITLHNFGQKAINSQDSTMIIDFQLLKHLKKRENYFIEIYACYWQKNTILLKIDDVEIVTRSIPGKFQSLENIIPELNKYVRVNCDNLIKALKELTPYAIQAANAAKLDIANNTISVCIGDFEKKIDINFEKKYNFQKDYNYALLAQIRTKNKQTEDTIIVNTKMLLNIVQYANCTYIDIAYNNNPDKPLIININ